MRIEDVSDRESGYMCSRFVLILQVYARRLALIGENVWTLPFRILIVATFDCARACNMVMR